MKALLTSILILMAGFAQAADPPKTSGRAPSKTMDLRSVTTSVEGDVHWRLNKKELDIMTAGAPQGPRPFGRGEPFLQLIPSPDDVQTFAPSPCASEAGLNCVPKLTPIGWVCKCQGAPGGGGIPDKGGGGGAVERCRLAFSQPLSEGISRLQCVSLTPCVGCCRFVRVMEASRLMFGCQCQ